VDIARIRSLYDGEVFYADFLFGRLVQALKTLGLADQALVVLTSDHGEEFKDHGGFQHGRLYEEHIRIPLLIHHPAMRKTERISTLVSNMDLLPTLLHAAGIKRHWEVDGRDLLEPEQKPGAVVSLAMTGEKHRAAALRFEGHKLIVDLSPLYRETLFDLEADPRETLNIAQNHPERVSTGLRALRRAVGEEAWTLLAETGLTGDPRTGLDSDSIEALRELGYVTE
jgi:arylsulfatase A-like enzyme